MTSILEQPCYVDEVQTEVQRLLTEGFGRDLHVAQYGEDLATEEAIESFLAAVDVKPNALVNVGPIDTVETDDDGLVTDDRVSVEVIVAASDWRDLAAQKNLAWRAAFAVRRRLQGQFVGTSYTSQGVLMHQSTVPDFTVEGLTVFSVTFTLDLSFDVTIDE